MDWTDWPASRQRGRAALVSTLIAATVFTVGSVDRWLAVVALVLLLMSVGEALLPTRYRINEDGVQLTHPFRRLVRPWSRVGTWKQVPGGVWLLSTSSNAFLRRRQSVLLRCPGREEQVLAQLASLQATPHMASQ